MVKGDSQAGCAPSVWEDEVRVLRDGDRGARAGVGAGRGHAGGVQLGQEVWGGGGAVKTLCDRGVHDAAGQDVREAAVITSAPTAREKGQPRDGHLGEWLQTSLVSCFVSM